MIPCFVAILALKVVTAHVNVEFPGRLKQKAVQVSVLCRIIAGPLEMARAACFSAWFSHVLGHGNKIDALRRHTRPVRILFITSRCIVTDKTIHAILVGKIEAVVLPTVTAVAVGTARPISVQCNKRVVYTGSCLSWTDSIIPISRVGRGRFPKPVRSSLKVFRLVFMATETFTRHFGRFWVVRQLHHLIVVGNVAPVTSEAVYGGFYVPAFNMTLHA